MSCQFNIESSANKLATIGYPPERVHVHTLFPIKRVASLIGPTVFTASFKTVKQYHFEIHGRHLKTKVRLKGSHAFALCTMHLHTKFHDYL